MAESCSSLFWEWLITRKTVKSSISRYGFFEVERKAVMPSYARAIRETEDERISIPLPSPSEYFSQTPELLREQGLYLVRTGNGNFIIFDAAVFPAPFLDLDGLDWDARELVINNKSDRNLRNAFRPQWNEQSFVKALHCSGVFDELVAELCNARGYKPGPSGALSSFFPFYMKNVKGRLARFVYEGTCDLDECLYPMGKDVIIPIEAKISPRHDLAWSKLAFPCYRFIDNPGSGTFHAGSGPKPANSKRTTIMPVYCLYDGDFQEAYLYAFRKIKVKTFKNDIGFKERGLVLNASKQLIPKSIFRANMSWIFR